MSPMFEWILAKRHLMANPRGVAFTVASVALAVGFIVVTMGIMESNNRNMISSMVEESPHLIVNPKEEEKFIHLHRTLDLLLWSYPGVISVSPRLQVQAAAKYKDNVKGVQILGIYPEEEEEMMGVREKMVRGDFYDLLFKKHAVVVGTKLAEDLELNFGEKIRFSRRNESMDLEVIGLVEMGEGSDSTLVYMPLETAQEFLGEGDVVSQVGVKLEDYNTASDVAAALRSATAYDARSWQDQNEDLLSMIKSRDLTNTVFFILILAIAGLGVANTMIMIVTRRTKEIGILAAMGASRRSTMLIFVIESMLQAPLAAILGIGLAFSVSKLLLMYPVAIPAPGMAENQIEVMLTPELLAYAMIFPVAVNFLAGIYPAYKAARLDPVEAIDSE